MRIKFFRLLKGLSQEALGKAVGVTRQTISSWEKGETTPTADHLFKLADVFGVSTDELKEVEKV